MLRVLKASAGVGVAKAKSAEGHLRGGGIEGPTYPAEGESHAWRFAGPPGGGVGRAAYSDLREFLASVRRVAAAPCEGITWLEFFA
eukprot:1239742-Alexandrium_andersonii.AAC.1